MASETHESQARDYTTIISKALEAWKKYDFKDLDLWDSYKEDFKDWTEDDFNLAGHHETRKVRTFLRKRGVWVEKSRKTIAKSLFSTLQEEDPTP